MGVLARADKRAVSYGVAGSLLLAIGGSFWALTHIEDELDDAAAGVASYVAEPGFAVEWNGRDGYLTVPAGTSRADAERVAADLSDLRGTRDVEIRFAEAALAEAGGADAGGAEGEAPSTTVDTVADANDSDKPPDSTIAATTIAETPASFVVEWDADGVTQTGIAPGDLSDEVALLGVENPMVGSKLTVEGNVEEDLAVLAPLIGTSLVSGTATIEEGVLSISGLASSEADLADARAALAATDAEVTIELAPSVGEPDVSDDSDDAQAALDALAVSGIQFETNTSTLTDGGEVIVDDLAAVLEAYPSIAIEIIGHTDSRGDHVANQALSEARAAAVVDALITRGIDSLRLQSSGIGEAQPIASNATAAGQQQNRRVEIKIKEMN